MRRLRGEVHTRGNLAAAFAPRTGQHDLRPLRIWLPHHAVLEVVALLGNRYRANYVREPVAPDDGMPLPRSGRGGM